MQQAKARGTISIAPTWITKTADARARVGQVRRTRPIGKVSNFRQISQVGEAGYFTDYIWSCVACVSSNSWGVRWARIGQALMYTHAFVASESLIAGVVGITRGVKGAFISSTDITATTSDDQA
jgi:hypothetical protein